MNPYETSISILTATPGMASDTQTRTDADHGAAESQSPWWQRALRTSAGRRVLSELDIRTTADGELPAQWEAHPLAEPNDASPEAALSVTVVALRNALDPRAGVMFLERSELPSEPHRRHDLHLCAIDPAGMRAALMAVC